MNLSQDYQWYLSLLGALAPQIPLFLAYLAGGIIALIRWKRHPRASLYLLISVVISFVTHIIVTVVQVWMPYYLATINPDARSFAYYYYALYIIGNLIHAIAFGLLLLAVFTERANRRENQVN